MEKKHILIIEDDRNFQSYLKNLLVQHDYSLTITDNGRKALQLTKESKPDLILCDIMLPGIDGYTVLEEIRDSELTRNIPFIFLSARREITDVLRGMNLGADDYLIKPFESQALIRAISIKLESANQS